MVVLMYHDIVSKVDKTSGFQNESAFQYKVDESAFEEQVNALQGMNVIYTFDDGGESFYTKAAPILEKYRLRGVFFVSTKYIGTPGFLTAEQVKELAARGHIIGSHSHTHPQNLAKLSTEDIKEEWQISHDILNELLDKREFPLSVPNGYTSKPIMEEAVKCGYTDIFTSQPTTITQLFQNHKIVGRYVVHDCMTAQDVLRIVESKGVRLKLALKWHVLNIVKGILGPSYDIVKVKLLHH